MGSKALKVKKICVNFVLLDCCIVYFIWQLDDFTWDIPNLLKFQIKHFYNTVVKANLIFIFLGSTFQIIGNKWNDFPFSYL